MKVEHYPKETYEIISIEEGETFDHKAFTFITANVYYQWYFPEVKRLSKRMKHVLPTIIYLWHDLDKNLPKFKLGDIIEGDLVKRKIN